ncbi:Rid family hydrolase [Aquipuribacter sp. MA13-6]|uniref:Rid family hydrolase n=1 Tax=unclassified Aquipuribacter TaxID=2635084 RepID=UPI003EF04549
MPSHATSDDPPALFPGVDYAYTATVPPGAGLVLTAGACPLDENGVVVAAGDVTAQTHQVMANLRTALRDAGSDLQHVARTTVYVASADPADLVAAWDVVRDAFTPHTPPSTLLGVTALGYPDQLVEVEATAVAAAPATDADDPDRDALLTFCLQQLDALTALVGALDDETANRRPDRPGANSLVAVLVHCCGMARRWSSTVNRGVPVPRDRDAEFTARMPVADALGLAATTREAFIDDVRATRLDAAPVAVPTGREDFWTRTCRGVLLHVLEELSQHLGQAEITRDEITHAA